MSNNVLWMGLVTLIGFPILGYFLSYGLDFTHVVEFLKPPSFTIIPVGYGLMFGFSYAFLALLFMDAPIFDSLGNRMEHLIKQLKLTVVKGLFLSVCAGVGEELLFRASVQPYLGIWITSILFVAIHGYLNPWNWKFSLYGIIILPFIILLSYGYELFGLWFAIMAHTAYDAVLFTSIVNNKDEHL